MPLAFFGICAYLACAEQQAIKRVVHLNGEYLFEDEYGRKVTRQGDEIPSIKRCLLHDVTAISFANTEVSSADLVCLKNLPSISILWLSNTDVDDDAIPYVTRLRNLKDLAIEDTQISAHGIAQIRQQLPNTDIATEHFSPFD